MTHRVAREGASEVASALAESIQYQGRKASRKGSEQRRQAILVGLENIDVDETRGILKRYLYLVTGL